MVTITTKLSQADYIRASLIILYRRPLIFSVSILLFLLLCFNITLLILGFNVASDALAIPVVLLFVTPFSTWMTARRTYRGNRNAQEQITYNFGGDTLKFSAATASSEVKIDSFKKVFKNANWIFLMNAGRNVNPIPRRDISDSQVAELKNILDANGVRNNL